MTNTTLTIRLHEADQHRRALLRLLQDTDFRLPANTANITVSVRLANDNDFWSVYNGLWGVRHACEAAPKELAELSTAVDAVLADMDSILDTAFGESVNAVR